MNIFVSSVAADLKRQRRATLKQIVGMGDRAIAMEDFGASPNPPLEECFAKLDEADLMVLILGPTYGSIHATSDLSYTENEFRYAIKRNLPVLAFTVRDLDRAVATNNPPENAEKYRKFISSVRSTVTHAEPFRSPDQLAALVGTAIHNYKRPPCQYR